MLTIEVINKHKTNITGPTVVNIMYTHGSPVGNPFYKLPRKQSISKFEEWFNGGLTNRNSAVSIEMERLRKLLIECGTLYLVCVCKPLPCHGDVIKKSLLESITFI